MRLHTRPDGCEPVPALLHGPDATCPTWHLRVACNGQWVQVTCDRREDGGLHVVLDTDSSQFTLYTEPDNGTAVGTSGNATGRP